MAASAAAFLFATAPASSFAASAAAFLLVAASAMPFICLSSQLLSDLVLLSSQLLSALVLRRATPAAAAASKSVTASVMRPPGDAVRSAPPSVVAGRPRKRSANTMLRPTAMGGGSSFVAAGPDRASTTGAAVVDTRLTLKSSRRNGTMAAAGGIGNALAQCRRSAPRSGQLSLLFSQNLHHPGGVLTPGANLERYTAPPPLSASHALCTCSRLLHTVRRTRRHGSSSANGVA